MYELRMLIRTEGLYWSFSEDGRTPLELFRASVEHWVTVNPYRLEERKLHAGFVLQSLRQTLNYEFLAWNAVPAVEEAPTTPKKAACDPFRLARDYQSLLDSGKFDSLMSLARYLNVSGPRVAQVLN